MQINITNVFNKTFTWIKSGTYLSGKGNLTFDAIKNLFILDFDTETRGPGKYEINVILAKDNYTTQTATIILTIINRDIEYELSSIFYKKQVNIVKGEDVKIEVELTDPTQGGIKISGAKVVLKIGGKEYDLDEDDPGVYSYTFSTENIDAFYTSNTLTGTIEIDKYGYNSEEIDITVVVEMEEIVEGVPTFYFIMITGAIAAVVGSLVSYRYIQIAKIPTFVKKARKIKKTIKSKDQISESLLYPSKEEFMVKELEEKYNNIGVSISELLGVKPKKGKILSDKIDSVKKKGGNV